MIVSVIGAAFIMCAAITVCVKYSAYERKRLIECESFLLLLRHIRAGISCLCKPIHECVRGFNNRALEEAGFLEALQKYENFSEAISECQSRLSLGETEINLLRSFGEALGNNFREEEMRLLDHYEKELEAYTDSEEEKIPKREKLCRTLVVTGAFAAVILFI